MKIETITKYVANDGTMFDNSLECIHHESKSKPLVIKSDSETLSNLIWNDDECSYYTNVLWSEYVKDKLVCLQNIYDIIASENKEKINSFVKDFDYYLLGDVIQFLELIRIDVEKM